MLTNAHELAGLVASDIDDLVATIDDVDDILAGVLADEEWRLLAERYPRALPCDQ